jgi:hypothetical protein
MVGRFFSDLSVYLLRYFLQEEMSQGRNKRIIADLTVPVVMVEKVS